MIELLIVVAITSVGFIALLDLQVSSVRGLTFPSRLTNAMNLAEHFLATVRMEAIEWTGPNGRDWNDPAFVYLSQTQTNPDWQVAQVPAGAPDAFLDQAGGETRYDPGLLAEFPTRQNPRFCIQYRLQWTNASQRLIRADVRVLWLRDESSWAQWQSCPASMANANNFGVVQFIALTRQIMINSI